MTLELNKWYYFTEDWSSDAHAITSVRKAGGFFSPCSNLYTEDDKYEPYDPEKHTPCEECMQSVGEPKL